MQSIFLAAASAAMLVSSGVSRPCPLKKKNRLRFASCLRRPRMAMSAKSGSNLPHNRGDPSSIAIFHRVPIYSTPGRVRCWDDRIDGNFAGDAHDIFLSHPTPSITELAFSLSESRGSGDTRVPPQRFSLCKTASIFGAYISLFFKFNPTLSPRRPMLACWLPCPRFPRPPNF